MINNSVIQKKEEKQKEHEVYCNSSCLSENLGQVRYIFTDKTGTLTKNEMILKYSTIYNHEYLLSPFFLMIYRMIITFFFAYVNVFYKIIYNLHIYDLQLIYHLAILQFTKHYDQIIKIV